MARARSAGTGPAAANGFLDARVRCHNPRPPRSYRRPTALKRVSTEVNGGSHACCGFRAFLGLPQRGLSSYPCSSLLQTTLHLLSLLDNHNHLLPGQRTSSH